MKGLIFIVLMMCCCSCATITGGKLTDCQRCVPLPNQPVRKLRPVAVVADLCFGIIPLLIDFSTTAIYKPCKQPK